MTMCIFFILYLWVPTYIAQLTLLFVFMYILIFEGVKLNVYHADIDNNIITLPILIICKQVNMHLLLYFCSTFLGGHFLWS